MYKIKRILFLLSFFLVMFSLSSSAQYVAGDFGSITTGNWNSYTTWGIYDGVSTWVPATPGFIPASGNNVFIRNADVVTVSFGSVYNCTNLTVESSAQLYSNDTITIPSPHNTYITIIGNIVCDGKIGNYPMFDNISFNIAAANCTISGAASGSFDASRIRKNNASSTSNLTISRNVNLRYSTSSTTQLYNNATLAIFNVTVSAGDTLNMITTGTNTGNICIDGLDGTGTSPAIEAGGTYTINGVLLVSGKLYLTTNNTNTTYKCNWIINGLVKANEVVASASGLGGHTLTINSGGKLELTGTPAFSSLSTTNNTFTINSGSTVEYSAAGNQAVRVDAEFGAIVPPSTQDYGNLILSGSGNKTTISDLWVKNNLTISGSAILDPPGNWNSLISVGGNWTNYSETGFNEHSTIVKFNGSPGVDITQPTTQYVTCPGGEVFYKMQFAKGASAPAPQLVFNSPIDIIDSLQYANSGSIDLNSNTLTIRDSVSTAISGVNASRFLISEKTDNSSKVKWYIGTKTGTYIIPFGVLPGGSNLYYVPVKFVKASTADIGYVTVSTYGTPRSNLPWPTTPVNVTNLQSAFSATDDSDAVVDRFWEVDATNPVSTDLTLQYRSLAELPAAPWNSAPAVQAQWYNSSINFWATPPSGTVSLAAVTVAGNTRYGTWTLVNKNSPLPINLLKFNAYIKDQVVITDWATATEINNDYFTIERSADGLEFFEIGKIKGAGNSSVTLDYSLPDEHPLPGVSYYRLKQTDFDGHFSYSPIVMVSLKKDQIFYLYPNPSKDIVYLASSGIGRFRLSIKNMEGKVLLEQEIDIKAGDPVSLLISNLAPGIYAVEIRNEFRSDVLKLIREN